MAAEKGWYWLAAGVLALGLNGAYQDGEFQLVHRLADHSARVLERAAEQGQRFVAMAEVMLGRNPESLARAEATLQQLETRSACRRVEMARREIDRAQVQRDLAAARINAQMAQVQSTMDRVRMITVERVARVRNCPELSRVIVMQNVPKVDLSDLPQVSIPELPVIQGRPGIKNDGPI